MKNTLLILLFVLTAVVCNAKNPTTPCSTLEAVKDNQIPKDVEKWLKAELANTTSTVLENFETPAFFTNKKAKIIGYIKGYDKTLGAKTALFYYTNQLTREDKPRALEIHEDGRFELELPLEYPTQNYFVIKSQVINFYLEPGQNLSIILNWEDLKKTRRISYPLKSVTYQGALGPINTNLLHYKPNYNSGNFQKKEAIMKPVAFKNYMLEFKTDALNKVNAYEQSGEIDKKTSELLRNDILLETYYSLFDYYSPGYYGQGQRKENNIDDTLPDDYYDFIKDLPLHKQSILVNKKFSSFINRLEYAAPLMPKKTRQSMTTGVFSADFLEFLESKNVTLSETDKKLLESVKQIYSEKKKPSEALQTKLSTFLEQNEALIKTYSHAERMEIHMKKMFLENWKTQDSLAQSLNIKNNLIYEIIKSRKLKFIMESDGMYKDKAWYWSELKKDIKSPHLIKLGDDLFERELAKPEFYELPENEPGTAIFKKIIAPYKGKLIVVQFWNPQTYYRGKDLERTIERRNKYKNNKDVVFLNIANDHRSSLEKYKTSVEKNGFKNAVRTPQDDYNYLRQLFKFNTTINNLLVAKDGVTVYDNFESHNMEYFLRDKFNIEPDN